MRACASECLPGGRARGRRRTRSAASPRCPWTPGRSCAGAVQQRAVRQQAERRGQAHHASAGRRTRVRMDAQREDGAVGDKAPVLHGARRKVRHRNLRASDASSEDMHDLRMHARARACSYSTCHVHFGQRVGLPEVLREERQRLGRNLQRKAYQTETESTRKSTHHVSTHRRRILAAQTLLALAAAHRPCSARPGGVQTRTATPSLVALSTTSNSPTTHATK